MDLQLIVNDQASLLVLKIEELLIGLIEQPQWIPSFI